MAEDETDIKYTESPGVLEHVPVPLRVAGAWSWRLVAIGVVAIAFMGVMATLAPIVVPVSIAVLIAAPLERVVTYLTRWKIPRALGAAVVIVALLGAVVTLLVMVGTSVLHSIDELTDRARSGLDTLVEWLSEGPLQLDEQQIQDYLDQAGSTLQSNSDGIVSGALSVTEQMGLISAGVIIALFCLYFFLKDGRKIWVWAISHLPEHAQRRVDYAGKRSWLTLAAYTKTTVFVAFVDAVGIGLGAHFLGVPQAFPIAVVVFLGSFIPIIGAMVTGAIAVLVALVDGGWTTALIMAIIVLAVQQIEGNVLYPWLFGRATAIHPVAIILTISAGTVYAGIVGALLAVPLLAFVKSFTEGLRRAGVGPTSQIKTRLAVTE